MRLGKRIAAALLGLVMIAAMSADAFADGGGAITVDNPISGQTYTAYKIFDVAYDTKEVDGVTVAGDHYSYTIDSGSKWFSTVKTYADATGSGLKLEQVAGTYYAVVTDGAFSAPAFAKAMKAAIEAGTVTDSGTPLIDNGSGGKRATGLALGYYLVTSNTGALCSLTTTNPTVTIHDKSDVPFEKADDRDSVEIGETVRYTITGKVPDTTGFTAYTYKITDSMSEGLSFKQDVTVKIGGTDVTGSCTLSTTATGFELTVPVMNYQAQVGAVIEVCYSAVVNEKAIAKVEKNRAVLTYSNDPTDNTSFEESPPQEESVYSAKIVIDKYEENPQNADDKTKKLAGAKFVLMNGEKSGYYYYDETTNKVSWVTLGAGETLEDVLKAGYTGSTKITEVTTDSTGAAAFTGLKDGDYFLLETAAPHGYNPLKEAVPITIKGTDDRGDVVEAQLTQTAEVANSTGAMLPSTGGIGTTAFYAAGSVLLVGAAVLLAVKRRRDRE